MSAQVESDRVLFEEEQAFRQFWLWAVMALSMAAAAGVLLVAIQSSPEQTGSILAAGGVALVVVGGTFLLLWFMKLRVRVTPEGLHVRFRPFVNRFIPLAEIVQCEARTYRPIVEYGGWGIRGSARGRAYNVSGNRGVQLVLADGSRILIGSQQPEELVEAIHRAKR